MSENERAEIAEAPTADTDAEFPTPWHREAYLVDLQREIDGAETRLKGLRGDSAERTAEELKAVIDNAKAEVARLTGTKATAKKKPAEA